MDQAGIVADAEPTQFCPQMDMCSELTLSNLVPRLPGSNELTHWYHMATENCVNIGSGNCLLPDGTWTNVDLLSVRSSGIHLRAILQEIPQPSVNEINLKITYLKFNRILLTLIPWPLSWICSIFRPPCFNTTEMLVDPASKLETTQSF